MSDQTRSLIDDSGPLLDSQAETADSIRTWARSLNGITGQVVQNDPAVRSILQQGPGFAQEVSALLDQVKPTLPILLANLTTVGQILLTYNPAIEQLLVLFPGIIAAQQSFGLPQNNPTGLPMGDFALTISDPNPCTVGFLPPSQWRSPEDETTIDTPDGLYCKLPQDSPLNVRGARNYPCIEHPGKRAPTVELCNDPRGFVPTSDRVSTCSDPTRSIRTWCRRAFRSTTGWRARTVFTRRCRAHRCRRARYVRERHRCPNLARRRSRWGTRRRRIRVRRRSRSPAPAGGSPGAFPAAPSAFDGNESSGPSVATAHYDQRTGQYLAPDGTLQKITNVASGAAPKSWKDLLPM